MATFMAYLLAQRMGRSIGPAPGIYWVNHVHVHDFLGPSLESLLGNLDSQYPRKFLDPENQNSSPMVSMVLAVPLEDFSGVLGAKKRKSQDRKNLSETYVYPSS